MLQVLGFSGLTSWSEIHNWLQCALVAWQISNRSVPDRLSLRSEVGLESENIMILKPTESSMKKIIAQHTAPAESDLLWGWIEVTDEEYY